MDNGWVHTQVHVLTVCPQLFTATHFCILNVDSWLLHSSYSSSPFQDVSPRCSLLMWLWFYSTHIEAFMFPQANNLIAVQILISCLQCKYAFLIPKVRYPPTNYVNLCFTFYRGCVSTPSCLTIDRQFQGIFDHWLCTENSSWLHVDHITVIFALPYMKIS